MSRVPSLRPRRGLTHAFSGAFVLVAALALSVTGTLSVRPAAHAEEGTPEPTQQATLIVAPEDSLLTASATEYRFELLLKNTGDEAIAGGTVTLSIDNQRAEGVEDLAEPSERDSLELTRVDALATEPGEDQRLEVTVARDDFPLLFTRESGVYPLRAEFIEGDAAGQSGVSASATATANADGGVSSAQPQVGEGAAGEAQGAGAQADTAETGTNAEGSEADGADADADAGEAAPFTVTGVTPVVWNGVDAASPLQLTLVVPLVLPGTVQALPSKAELASAAPRLAQLFEAAEQHHATIAIDPRIIAGTRALGTNAPGAATTLLDRIERSSAPIFLLQFADADPAVQAALGFDTLLQPSGFDHATALGAFEGVTDVAESDTSVSADEVPLVDPVTGVPSLEAMMTLDGARPGAWPAGGEVDSATLSLLQQSGLTSLVIESDNVSSATTPRVTLGNFDALITDTRAGQAARTSIEGESATERAAASAELASLLALQAQAGTGGLVLALDRGALADIADPLPIFDALDSMPWVQTVSERLQASGTAVLKAGTSTEERRELLRATVNRSQQIDDLAPLLDHPEYLTEYQRERLLGAFATRYAEPGVDFAAVDRQIKKRDSELLGGVKPLVSENTQLVGALSNVPITLNNALPFEAVVNLHATPTSAAISVTERDFEVRVPAAGTTNVLVPVHSRVSSGDTDLLLEVQDRLGSTTFASALHPLTLRTTVETVLIWVLSSAAALLLGFGIWRSVRRRRSRD